MPFKNGVATPGTSGVKVLRYENKRLAATHRYLQPMPLHATRYVRKMRGAAQSHLLQCDDGQFYVVKFSNNPQHPRILINEWIASACLKYLQISTPATAIVNLTDTFLAQEPEVFIQLGSRRLKLESGPHFGSRYPGDPFKVHVYDFLPDLLLGQAAAIPSTADPSSGLSQPDRNYGCDGGHPHY